MEYNFEEIEKSVMMGLLFMQDMEGKKDSGQCMEKVCTELNVKLGFSSHHNKNDKTKGEMSLRFDKIKDDGNANIDIRLTEKETGNGALLSIVADGKNNAEVTNFLDSIFGNKNSSKKNILTLKGFTNNLSETEQFIGLPPCGVGKFESENYGNIRVDLILGKGMVCITCLLENLRLHQMLELIKKIDPSYSAIINMLVSGDSKDFDALIQAQQERISSTK